MLTQIQTIVELVCIFTLVASATMLTFRLAGFPDLSVDGVFVLGAVVLAKCVTSGMPVSLAFVMAVGVAAFAGAFTAVTSWKLRINPLLASVLTLTILYTVNLRILGKATQPLFQLNGVLDNPLVLPAITSVVVLLIWLLLRSEFGCAVRSAGTAKVFLISVGRNVPIYKVLLVSAASALVGLAGALMATRYGFADVSMGVGVVVVGIASLIIGEKLLGRFPFIFQILAVPVGVATYELAVGVALSLGLHSTDVKLITGGLAFLLLAVQNRSGEDIFAQGG